jgi:hypothetical protein
MLTVSSVISFCIGFIVRLSYTSFNLAAVKNSTSAEEMMIEGTVAHQKVMALRGRLLQVAHNAQTQPLFDKSSPENFNSNRCA